MSGTFFMVWNPNGRAPTYKHESYKAAVTEAERLSRLCPGESFYVLQAVSITKKTDVETVKLVGPDDEIPF
jgi:hypothetical protein